MPKSMKIARVTPLMLERCLCVTVKTTAEINGPGESGDWGFLDASQEVLTRLHVDGSAVDQ